MTQIHKHFFKKDAFGCQSLKLTKLQRNQLVFLDQTNQMMTINLKKFLNMVDISAEKNLSSMEAEGPLYPWGLGL